MGGRESQLADVVDLRLVGSGAVGGFGTRVIVAQCIARAQRNGRSLVLVRCGE